MRNYQENIPSCLREVYTSEFEKPHLFEKFQFYVEDVCKTLLRGRETIQNLDSSSLPDMGVQKLDLHPSICESPIHQFRKICRWGNNKVLPWFRVHFPRPVTPN